MYNSNETYYNVTLTVSDNSTVHQLPTTQKHKVLNYNNMLL